MSDEFKSMKSIEMAEKKNRGNSKDIKELIVNTLIMLAIALVAGGVLGFVHELTKEPIAAMAALTGIGLTSQKSALTSGIS